jgi:nitrite reductase/ring-hydroxylating ferredoxin subunit
MGTFVRVADVKDIPVSEALVIEEQGHSIAIFNVSGNLHAMNNICPHQGGPLGEGIMDGHNIICPLHGWQFDCRNGEAVGDGHGVSVQVYQVKTEGNDILVEIPD